VPDIKVDLTQETPVNIAACAYRDYRTDLLTHDGATLILTHALKLPEAEVRAALNTKPWSDDLARHLCQRTGWEHHDQTDGFPCSACRRDAEYLSAAAEADDH
jgi:hypothetical protein